MKEKHHAKGKPHKGSKVKKIIGKKVNKKQISNHVKEAVEKTSSCNTDLYAFYSSSRAAKSHQVGAQLESETNSRGDAVRCRLMQEVAAMFDGGGGCTAAGAAADSLQRVSLLETAAGSSCSANAAVTTDKTSSSSSSNSSIFTTKKTDVVPVQERPR